MLITLSLPSTPASQHKGLRCDLLDKSWHSSNTQMSMGLLLFSWRRTS